MDTIVSFLGNLLGYIMNPCYAIVRNYGIAIIIFTFLTKIILLPVSIMVHRNSIKMVKMQPEINFAKANYFGDKDQISEELLKLYKKYDYHPMLGLIPLAIQIILLMGVIDVIYKPLKHIFRFSADIITATISRFSELSGMSTEINSIQIAVADALKKGLYVDDLASVLGSENIASVQTLNMNFCGLNLAEVPGKVGGILILIPILAAFCAWLLCVVQNKVNVLQSEQSKLNKAGTMILSVGLSLYLGFFFPSLEPFGIAAVEALAAGCPVIAYQEGGSRDFVQPKVNGLLFPHQTAASLERVLHDFQLQTFDPDTVARTVQRFDQQHFRQQIQKLENSCHF